jgi:tRNA (cytidine/uridine-2'-O-)-methyltransferase
MEATTPILHVALVEPDIAPNVGTIARLCAATATRLHLVGRLGFHFNERALRRAGLDYWPFVALNHYPDWQTFHTQHHQFRCLAFSARATTEYTDVRFENDDCLVFGSETKGLPESLLHGPQSLPSYTIKMFRPEVRCLNVAMAVGIVLYEAIRQIRQR